MFCMHFLNILGSQAPWKNIYRLYPKTQEREDHQLLLPEHLSSGSKTSYFHIQLIDTPQLKSMEEICPP